MVLEELRFVRMYFELNKCVIKPPFIGFVILCHYLCKFMGSLYEESYKSKVGSRHPTLNVFISAVTRSLNL